MRHTESSTSRHLAWGLAASLCFVIASSPGCSTKKDQPDCDIEIGDECESSSSCGAGESCKSDCTCGCDMAEGAECETNSNCQGAATCNQNTCACESPVEIPASTTDCTVDSDGCLVGGETTCSAQFDAPLGAATATVHVEGTLLDDPANQAIHLRGYVGNPMPPYFFGYSCSLFRTGTAFSGTAASGSLDAVDGAQVGSADWSTPSGDYPFGMDLVLDTGATSASCTVTGDGAPTTPMESSAMNTAEGDILILELWRTRVCTVTVTSP